MGTQESLYFNTALLACSFWRAVSSDNIWQRVIKDKYLGDRPLTSWLRKPCLFQRWASPFWKGLVTSSHVILHWLRWRPGVGDEIKIGRDKIIGLDDLSILSLQLRSHLLSLNLTSLAQLKKGTGAFPLPDSWLHSSELALGGHLAQEFDSYTTALRCSGLSLSVAPDALTWTGGDGSGRVVAKNVYDALLSERSLWHSHVGSADYGPGRSLLSTNYSFGFVLMTNSLLGSRFAEKVGRVQVIVCFVAEPRRTSTTCSLTVLLPKRFGIVF
jgi:hypothetical protein